MATGEAPAPDEQAGQEGIIDHVPGITDAGGTPMDPRLEANLTRGALNAIVEGRDEGASAAELNQQFPAPARPAPAAPVFESRTQSSELHTEPYTPTEGERVQSPAEIAALREQLRQEGKL